MSFKVGRRDFVRFAGGGALGAAASGVSLEAISRFNEALAAEQMETLEDIVAEARARREEQLLAEGNGHHAAAAAEVASAEDEAVPAGARRRGNGRRRVS